MSRQAILSMPLSFAIVLVAAMALSGTARQAELGLPVENPGDPLPVADEAIPAAPPEAPVEVEQPIAEPSADPLSVEEHGSVPETPDLPDATALPPDDTSAHSAVHAAPEPPPALTSPESSSSRDREHWRPIVPRSTLPSP